MSRLQFKTVPLRLNEKQKQFLKAQYEQFLHSLEEHNQLRPDMMNDLKKGMTEVAENNPQLQIFLDSKVKNKIPTVIRLTEQDNDLLNLPWRLLTNGINQLYLTKSFIAKDRQPTKYKPNNPLPLKILVMIASPDDSDWKSRLSYEEEEKQLLYAFGALFSDAQVQIDFTDDGSLEALEAKLKQNHYHILHFSGHGVYRNGKGWLILENHITLNKALVTAEDFAKVLSKNPNHIPPLVVLSSCQTAQGNYENNISGVTNQLLQIGVPAVVGMGWSILDSYATRFAAQFYRYISKQDHIHLAFHKATQYIRQLEYERKISDQNINTSPLQWMIPQLYISQEISHLLDWKGRERKLQFKSFQFISGLKNLVLERRENYRFIGRRKEKKAIIAPLLDYQPILLKGQGGVGKTAMAEYLVRRLIAYNPKTQPFIISEKKYSFSDLLEDIKDYLAAKYLQNDILYDEFQHNKAKDKLLFLLDKLDKVCFPVFIFDNLEFFQQAPGEAFTSNKYSDLLELMNFFYKTRRYPLIFTARYPLAEFPDILTIDLKQVSLNDFLKQCEQLSFKVQYDKAVKTLFLRDKFSKNISFREMAELLYQTLGGNFRVLEFFNELFCQNRSKVTDILQRLSTTRERWKYNHLAGFKEQYIEEQEHVFSKISKDILFEELLQLLSDNEKQCLYVLSHFRIPVQKIALQLQGIKFDLSTHLNHLLDLTLIEQYYEAKLDNIYYYCTPIIKDLLKQVQQSKVDFSWERGGRYHYYILKNVKRYSFLDLEQAYECFYLASNKKKVNEIGERLCHYLYEISNYNNVIYYGKKTEELLREETNADIWNNLGLVFNLYGKYDTSLNYYEKALKFYEKNGDKSRKATILNNIGNRYRAVGDYMTALAKFEQVIETAREIGDKKMESIALNSLAVTHHYIGKIDKALSYLEKSLKISRNIKDRIGEGDTLNNIGEVYRSKGNAPKALNYLEQSLRIRKEIGDKSGESTTLGNISQIFQNKGDFETAQFYLEKDLKICQEIGDINGEGTTLNNLGDLYRRQENYSEALKYLEQSLKIRKKIGDRSGEAASLNNISLIYLAEENLTTSLSYLEQVLEIVQEIGYKRGISAAFHNMAKIAYKKEKFEQYFEYEMQAYQIANEIEDLMGLYHIGLRLGKYLCQKGDVKRGMSFLQQSYQIAKQGSLSSMAEIATLIQSYSSKES